MSSHTYIYVYHICLATQIYVYPICLATLKSCDTAKQSVCR